MTLTAAETAIGTNDFDTLVERARALGLQVTVTADVRKASDYGPAIATRSAVFTAPEVPGRSYTPFRSMRLMAMQVGSAPERVREATVYRDGITSRPAVLADLLAALDTLPYTALEA